MDDLRARLFKLFHHKDIQCEVEEELRFHLELLTEEHLRQGLTLAKARDEALKRFGNIERIKNQCVEIHRRNHPFMRALKSFLIVIFLTGVLIRILSADIYGQQVGDMLIAIGALGRLLLYLRGLSLSKLNPEGEILSPLRLSDNGQMPVAEKNRQEMTPVERLISDE